MSSVALTNRLLLNDGYKIKKLYIFLIENFHFFNFYYCGYVPLELSMTCKKTNDQKIPNLHLHQ